jgi:hypothetical protein
MRQPRILLLLAALAVVGTGCLGVGDRYSRTIELQPGQHTYQLGEKVEVGDRIQCLKPNGQRGSSEHVPERGHGVGNGVGFSVSTKSSGEVEIVCPTNPAYA